MNELVMELRDRLDHIAMIGIASSSDDFRLKAIGDKLQVLSKKAPVFKKLHELVVKLLERGNTQKEESLLELTNLVYAVLGVQSKSTPEGEGERPQLFGTVQIGEVLPYSRLAPLKQLFISGGTGKWDALYTAYSNKELQDIRLLHTVLQKSDDTYVYNQYDYMDRENDTLAKEFSIATILAQYGEPIIPILLDRFDDSTEASKANFIKVISHVGKEKYNDYYKKWAIEEKAKVKKQAILALAWDPENETFLMDLDVGRGTELKDTKLMALALMGSEKSTPYLLAAFKKRPKALKDIVSLSQYEGMAEGILQEIRYMLSDIKDREDFYKNLKKDDSKAFYKDALLNQLCDYLYALLNKKSDSIVEILQAIVEHSGIIGTFINDDYMEVTDLVGKMLLDQHSEGCYTFLIQQRETWGYQYIRYAFIAAVNTLPPEQVYDMFSPICLERHRLKKQDYLGGIAKIIEWILTSNEKQALPYVRKLGGRQNITLQLEERGVRTIDPRWLKDLVHTGYLEAASYMMNPHQEQEMRVFEKKFERMMLLRNTAYGEREKWYSCMRGLIRGEHPELAKWVVQMMEKNYYTDSFLEENLKPYHAHALEKIDVKAITNTNVQQRIKYLIHKLGEKEA